MPARRPLVVAHRGSSAAVAEHTLASYEQAIAEGADGLECDVRLTRDGVLVCVHDRRVDRTSDGRGVVSTLELADLAELDFGAGRRRRPDGDRLPEADPRFLGEAEEPDRDRFGVLTLERLIQLVLDADRPVKLFIETKHPTRYAGRVERSLVALLERYGLTEPISRTVSQVTVMSFAPTSLRRVHYYAPVLPTVLLLERVPRWLRAGELPRQVTIAGPGIDVVRAHPDYVPRVQERGHQVACWTVDDPEDVDLVLRLGVDVVISNRPRSVLDRL